MHWDLAHILADSDSDAIKIGIYVIIGVIWLISAMVKKVVKGMSGSAAQKRAAPATWTPPPTAPQLSTNAVVSAPVAWKPVSVPAPQAALPVSLPPALPGVKVVKKKQKKKAMPAVAVQRVVLAEPVPEVASVMGVDPALGGVGQSEMATMLRGQLQPGALRREFLTMELLGKPLALREGPGTGGVG